MTSPSTRDRLIQAALDLFVSQGISNTTTRQIANLAGVNEVTLFRNFGNKYGLLLTVIEESPLFAELPETLRRSLPPSTDLAQSFSAYVQANLRLLGQVPELVRSLIGEADQYPPENRRAIGQCLTQATRSVAEYFAPAIADADLAPPLSPDQFAALLHCLLLGYAVIECTSEAHQLWPHQDQFIDTVTQLFLRPQPITALRLPIPIAPATDTPATTVMDLPPSLVQTILQSARKASPQDYALAYGILGAGLFPTEVVYLQRIHHSSEPQQQLLRLSSPQGRRQVAINQWIGGKRYGTPKNNPLTKWLKTRKDDLPALFLDETDTPLTLTTVQHHWQRWTEGLRTPEGQPPKLIQAHQTWCIDMLMRGISLENLTLLTGQSLEQLQPYADRAREKIALEQAIRLDRKPTSPPSAPPPTSGGI
ncbi:TetR/AcrR family transcriptional regulator [Leptolyngbya sp. PCC 6406]|uniref:TetR/AcrR family transcriptional regulator n=1 Tax=Leptolyngbya sp. PCC 6406 TaxID=1173264 RepID=UPI0002ABB112|nr:TetR/AcrR family transcriptional regulator [Leptolyngbya sp. PCC 6406]